MSAIAARTPVTPADAFAAFDVDASAQLAGHERMEDYLARYLHQSYETIAAMPEDEMVRRVDNVIRMINRENGKDDREPEWT